MSHTPGPWLQSSTVLVCDQEARVIANCTPLVDVPALAMPMQHVDANARLIAAAPDLLAALDNILSRHVEEEFIPTEYWDAAKEAIAKAKGLAE